MVQMTRMLAIEWAAHDIRVNAVAPGRHARRLAVARRDRRSEIHAAMIARIPLHRLAPPRRSRPRSLTGEPAGGSVTGQVLVLDGGLTAA